MAPYLQTFWVVCPSFGPELHIDNAATCKPKRWLATVQAVFKGRPNFTENLAPALNSFCGVWIVVRLVVRCCLRLVVCRPLCFLHYASRLETRRLTPVSLARRAEDPHIESKNSTSNGPSDRTKHNASISAPKRRASAWPPDAPNAI